MCIQAWPYLPSAPTSLFAGTVTVTSGSPNVLGDGSTTFLSGIVPAVAGGQYTFGNSGTLYTVLSVTDDHHLVLTANYVGTTTSGLVMTGPFNLPPTTAQSAAIAAFEGAGHDIHVLVLQRDEATGRGKYLYEAYTDNDVEFGSNDGGSTWGAGFLGRFDLESGTQWPDGTTTGMACGMPEMPFLVRADEVQSGAINHPLRLIPGPGVILAETAVWPALHAASGSVDPPATNALPMGSRMRLSATWYAANVASFSTANQVILTALKQYGGWITDGGWPGYSLGIDGVNADVLTAGG